MLTPMRHGHSVWPVQASVGLWLKYLIEKDQAHPPPLEQTWPPLNDTDHQIPTSPPKKNAVRPSYQNEPPHRNRDRPTKTNPLTGTGHNGAERCRKPALHCLRLC
jgi:hypothetical protein